MSSKYTRHVFALALLLAASAPAALAASCACPADVAALSAIDWAEASACAAIDMEEALDESKAVMSEDMTKAAVDGQRVGQFWDLRTYADPISGREQYPWVFSKTFDHDPVTGFPYVDEVDTLLLTLLPSCMTKEAFDGIALYGAADASGSPLRVRKLYGVPTGENFNFLGCATQTPTLRGWQPVDSPAHAFEMAEVYGMALLRDVPFTEFGTDSTALAVIAELNKFADKSTAPTGPAGAITPQTLFRRGRAADELAGPYISQFMLKPFDYGNLRGIEQRFSGEADPDNGLSQQAWLDLQRGVGFPAIAFTPPSLTSSARVLGAKVHNDPFYQFYHIAALIAMANGIAASEYDHPKTTAWTSGGAPDVLAALAHITLGALRTAWHQKWALSLRIRPEVMAQRLELASNPGLRAAVPGLQAAFSEISKADGLLELVRADNERRVGSRSLFLAGQFPEGSPTHPSLPSGHAVVAGACATVLKAMLKTHEDDGRPIRWVAGGRTAEVASADGQSLEPYADADASEMTVVGELNKLASNVALGRDWAGVHYRTDGESGIMAGEQFALAYLRDKLRETREDEMGLMGAWTLQKFDGTFVTITQQGASGAPSTGAAAAEGAEGGGGGEGGGKRRRLARVM